MFNVIGSLGPPNSFDFFASSAVFTVISSSELLKRGKRGGHGARVACEMQHARHLRARVAIRASERHGEGAFN